MLQAVFSAFKIPDLRRKILFTLAMLVIFLLANGVLQQMVQPVAFGATLDLNPLVVLIVTIGAGCLFGMIGLVLAAPLTSALTHIARDLRRLSGEDLPEESAGHA